MRPKVPEHQADGRWSELVRAVRKSRFWPVWCEQQRQNYPVLIAGFLTDSACKIGSDSSVREITLIDRSGKRTSAWKKTRKQRLTVVSMITPISPALPFLPPLHLILNMRDLFSKIEAESLSQPWSQKYESTSVTQTHTSSFSLSLPAS